VPKPIQKLSLCVPWDVCYDHSTDLTESMEDPIAFAASSNPDILYLQDAMKANDHKKFKKAMAEEVKSHEDNDHWELIKRDQAPHGTPILPAVWAFASRHKRSTNGRPDSTSMVASKNQGSIIGKLVHQWLVGLPCECSSI